MEVAAPEAQRRPHRATRAEEDDMKSRIGEESGHYRNPKTQAAAGLVRRNTFPPTM